jgi:two-component system, NarL family, sensor kinase
MAGRRRSSPAAPARELVELRRRLAEAEDALRAISNGEVDAVVVAGARGDQVFTLQGAEHAYRLLIESMNEGALILTSQKTILYANQCFAKMVKCPLEQVMGGSLRRFLSAEDHTTLRPLLLRADKSGTKAPAVLIAGDGSRLPVQISMRRQGGNGLNAPTVAMVVTDLTESRRTEELLRALTHRVVQVQESERERVAFELHDNITQLVCAVVFRSQMLLENLPAHDGPSRERASKLRDMLGAIASEVARISHNLGSSLLDHLGLAAVLREAKTEFADRTGVSVKLTCMNLAARLPEDAELAIYRILQESLRNVEKHANARHVTVSLRRRGAFVQLVINDDGAGFDQAPAPARRKNKGGLGLVSMRERANFVGGTLKIRSVRRAGTEIEALIPIGSLPSRELQGRRHPVQS